MNFYKKRRRLFQDFAVIIAILVIVTGFYVVNRINQIESQFTHNELASQTRRIERNFSETINYTSSMLGYMGRQIADNAAKSGKEDLEYIDNLFQAFTQDPFMKEVLSWTAINWVNRDYQAVVDGYYHVMKEPTDLSSRDYMQKTIETPWKLVLGSPVLGTTSNEWIIPAAFGITDVNGDWLGTLVVGFQQQSLQKNFSQLMEDNDYSFALVGSAGDIVIEGPGRYISDHEMLNQDILPLNLDSSVQDPVVSVAQFSWGRSYYYYKVPSYDFVVFVSHHNPLGWKRFEGMLWEYLPEVVVLMALLLLFFLYLHNRIVRPIKLLASATNVIAKPHSRLHGQSNVIIPTNTSHEIFQLIRGLTRLDVIKRRNERLLKEIEDAKNSIEDAFQAKTDFMAYTAHELRSPLNAIITGSEVIEGRIFGQDMDKYQEYATMIKSSGEDLLRFVNDLLDQVQAESGMLNVRGDEKIDVTDNITRAIKLVVSRASKHNLTIEYDVHETLPYLLGDGQRIRQVVVNLLTNAIKYSPAYTVITVQSYMKEDQLVIKVIDQGYGMKEEQINQALEKYGTLHNPSRGNVPSIGLGLPLTLELIKRHDGDFTIESEVDKGTTITIIFPSHRLVLD